MNNRFVKNNIGLLAMTTVCSVVALAELAAVIVYSLQMYGNIQVVKDLSGEIRGITQQRPVPVRENEEPIKKDTAAYEKACQDLQKEFGRPLDPAVGHFFKALRIKKSTWLPEDVDVDADPVVRRIVELSKRDLLSSVSNAEFDRALAQISGEAFAKRIKELAPEDETLIKVKALIPDVETLKEDALAGRIAADAALTGKIRELFPDAEPETLKKLRDISETLTAEQFIAAYDKLMDGIDEKNYATRRMNFQDFRRDKFENWKAAREAFINAAENRGSGDGKKSEPCIVEKLSDSNADDVLLAALGKERRFDGKAEQLQEMIRNISDQLKKEYNITLYDRASGLGIVTAAETTGNEPAQGSDINNINSDDYPAIATHLDIIGYMLYRVGSAGVDIWDVQIRLSSSESGDGNAAERRFGNSKYQRDGGFDVYHYTLEISGTMAQIRAAMKRLDDCYDVRRVYLVKNISLYAESNIVDGVFEKPADNPFLNMAAQRNVGAGGEDGGANDEEARRKKALEDLEKYKARQARLEYDKRDGYGAPITAGGETERFRAVIDVEYVIKPR